MRPPIQKRSNAPYRWPAWWPEPPPMVPDPAALQPPIGAAGRNDGGNGGRV